MGQLLTGARNVTIKFRLIGKGAQVHSERPLSEG